MSRKTVAIVGSHTRTKDFAPYDRRYVDIWVFNEAASLGWPPRVSAVIQMHKPAVWKNPLNRNDPKHYEWLQKKHPFPIYMLEQYPEVPSCVRYPIEEVRGVYDKLFVRGRKENEPVDYFTSGPAYGIALAILQEYEEIQLYGIEMETNTEYNYQRDGVALWSGIAIGMGIKLVVHPLSNLFRAPLYGYEGDAFVGLADFEARKAGHEATKPEMEKRLDFVNQQQRAALEFAAKSGDGEYTKQYFDSIKQQAQAMMQLGKVEGAIGECERYIGKAKTMDEHAGEHLFSRQEFEQVAAKANEVMAQYKSTMDGSGGLASASWKELHKAVVENRTDDIHGLAEKYSNAHQDYLKAVYAYGRTWGIEEENVYYLHRIDELVKAAGGAKSEEALIQAHKNKMAAAYAQAI